MKTFSGIPRLLLVLTILTIHGCKKGEVPILITSDVSGVTSSEAFCGGSITDEGDGTIVSRGVCYSIKINPTIKDLKTSDGAGAGKFTSKLTGLAGATTYYARAYATNSEGTGYGMTMSFKTYPSGFPSSGLIAYYTFAEGKALNIYNYENSGKVSGIISTSDRFSRPEESFQFDSENDRIIVLNPNFKSNNTGTLAAWVKFDNLDRSQYVASIGDTTSVNNYFGFIRLDNISHTLGVYQRLESGIQNWVNGSTVVSAGVYYHVAVKSDGLSWSLYINGVKESLIIKSGSNTGKWMGYLQNIDNFTIGNSVRKKPYLVPWLSGKIDEVILYDRALADIEILNLYTVTSGK